MRSSVIYEGIAELDTYSYSKRVAATATLAMILGLFVGCEEAYTPAVKEPVKVSASTFAEIAVLSEQIKQSVTQLEYFDEVPEDFAKMVIGWKNEEGRPFLIVWKSRLVEAKQNYNQRKISKDQLAKVEETAIRELSQKIKKEISYNEKLFDLADVVKSRQAQCVSYSQVFYVLGSVAGLSVRSINVVELASGALPVEAGEHVACVVSLADATTVIVDLVGSRFISQAFEFEKEFTEVGNYWELKNKMNPLGIHRRVQVLDRDGLIAYAYNNRGYVHEDLGQHAEAISDFNNAIRHSPKFAAAYNSRGCTYVSLGQYKEAISDFSKAIELNPTDVSAYHNRGGTYFTSGAHAKAVSDFTKVIELVPKKPSAYYNRGVAYANMGQAYQAISDYTKTIELAPEPALAYHNRGVVYAALGKHEEAKRDLLKAVELVPALKANAKKASDIFKLDLDLD